MLPVAVFRFSPTGGPADFAQWLGAHGIAHELVPIDGGAPPPRDLRKYSGVAMMGGPMSVNDDLPWIGPACELLRGAVAANVPVIGHCLGGQLLARALGGEVTANPVKEIGWNRIQAEDTPLAREWLGEDVRDFVTFQWHGETFSIPDGAVRLLGNSYCANQMYALGPHFGMQCHVEMTPEMIATWGKQWAAEAEAVAHLPSAQTPAEMLVDIEAKLPVMRQLADRIYGRWIEGLKT